MGLLDRFKKNKMVDQASSLTEEHGDKIAEGVDKATDVVDDKTGGKYTDQLDKVDDMAAKLGDGNDGDQADEGAQS